MKSLKHWFSNRVVLAVFSFTLGVLSLLAVQGMWSFYQMKQLAAQRPPSAEEFYDRFFKEDDFFSGSQDPWSEMQEMQKQMMKRFGMFENGSPLFRNFPQDLTFENQKNQIQKREDDQYVYYEVLVEGDAQKKLEVKVEDGQILLSGEVEKKINEGNGETTFTSNFHQSFPVPENTDPSKVEVQNEQGKVILKFPKV